MCRSLNLSSSSSLGRFSSEPWRKRYEKNLTWKDRVLGEGKLKNSLKNNFSIINFDVEKCNAIYI